MNTSSVDGTAFANELNNLFIRFDEQDFSSARTNLSDHVRNSIKEEDSIELQHVSLSDVEKSLRNVKCNKAAGPDKICGKFLKTCYKELAVAFHSLFQWSLDIQAVPRLWKSSVVVSIPKIPKPIAMSDYRPIALTAIPMKCFEKIIKGMLLSQTKAIIDPCQFAYRERRGVEDAVITLLHKIYVHLEDAATYARFLFLDFSSTFNTIQAHVLMEKLQQLEVNPVLNLWIMTFLTGRPHRV